MSGNGNHPKVEAMFNCPRDHFYVATVVLQAGVTGSCEQCDWQYEIGHDDIDDELVVFWERRIKSVLLVDSDYSIRSSLAESELYEDVLGPLRDFKDKGYYVVLMSHSDMVATGFVSHSEANHALSTIASDNGEIVDMVQACHAHPRAEAEDLRYESMFRPPRVGMLASIERRLYDTMYRADWGHSLIVSDRIEAFLMARRAGVAFDWSWEFFDRPWPFAESDNVTSRERFETVAISERRSPNCQFCLGREEGISHSPVRRGPHDHHWRHLDRTTFGSDEPKYLLCSDPDWPQAAAGAL